MKRLEAEPRFNLQLNNSSAQQVGFVILTPWFISLILD